MAGFTYDSRRKLTESMRSALAEKGAHLSEQELKMLSNGYYYNMPSDVCMEMQQLLRQSDSGKLSDLYRSTYKNVVDVCVAQARQEEFYDALDAMNCYQMTAGWYRRSMRSDSYLPFVENSIQLLWAYAHLEFYGGNLAAVLTGNISEELYDHARNEFAYSWILAAQIDRGEEQTIQAVRDILFGEGNTLMMSHELVRGIVMSRSQALYQDLGKFLLAARLQEGARQVVCETMDEGRPEAFLYLFSMIEENDLIRYSSIKRAVSTWIGIFNEKSVDRISGKLLQMMGQCLRDADFLEDQLASDDAVAISCALWAKGFYNADDAVETVVALIRNGTKHQKMTASYFCHSLQDEDLQMRVAKEVLLSYAEDLELVACFLPCFMSSGKTQLYALLRKEDEYNYSFDDGEVRKPKPLSPEPLFQDSAEAEAVYGILKGILGQLPKKGLKISPCIFPWHEIEMTPSDIAERICVIAWMLQKDEYLDEAAGLIGLVGQGKSYNASRAAAARVLLYHPKSATRKKVLFELLHNAEEYTSKAAYKLAADIELTTEDYRLIEQNLNYKKGRAGTLKLLRRQDGQQLAECIHRLLTQKSEECHMGALDLALCLQKKDKTAFAAVIPALQALKNPTGKEQVILDELLGEGNGAQDILNLPGYGLYDVEKEWIIPEIAVDESDAEKLFADGEDVCIRVLKKLDSLIDENREREYKTAWGEDQILGNGLDVMDWQGSENLDKYPFRALWQNFYETEIQSPQQLLEVHLYCKCIGLRSDYKRNAGLYQKVFGYAFSNLDVQLTYHKQVTEIISALYDHYVTRLLRVHFGLCVTAKLFSLLDSSNDLFTVEEESWGTKYVYTKRALDLPVFRDMCQYLDTAEGDDWVNAFALRFRLQQYYYEQHAREVKALYGYHSSPQNYLALSDYVQCYVRGIWDKDLFYKAVFTYCDIGILLEPVSTVEQKGAVSSQAAYREIHYFFGYRAVPLVDGKYHFDEIGNEMPEMAFAHTLYNELIPVVLEVELKRGEQTTPFSNDIHRIRVIYGIDYMIRILTALGKDPLQRSSYYYSCDDDRRHVLSHLLKVSMPKPEETAQDLKKALKGTDITKKRLVELAMYAQQWLPMIEEYLEMPGFSSACYYFIAHTSEGFDDKVTSVIAKYTPLSPEELRDGAFDVQWFFEAYGKLGEKNFMMLYDAAKYSSTGTAHGRARKYADAALGKVDRKALEAEIDAKRNKDLLMSIGLLPLPKPSKKREKDLLDRYQFIQKYKKESRQFGAQRRASEGRAVEIALRNLSVNAGFTDVTRLTLRMEGKLTEQSAECFDWQTVGDIEIMIHVDENGKSALQCKKDGKLLKSIPAKYKKNETVLQYQTVVKKLKEQYSRTRQMMEQAMEDRTSFEVWEFLELNQNPIVRPITEPLVVRTVDEQAVHLGFLTKDGIMDCAGTIFPVKPKDQIYIAHPFDLYRSGHWHEYQKLLFEKQLKQPFKQVFRELYVKLDEELNKHHSMLFSGNQIQPQKTVGVLRGRRWVADYEDGLQKVYYKENIVACIYAMADWFSPSDTEAPTLEYVVFSDRKTGKSLKIKEIPDIIYSEVMRDVDLAVSVAHAGGVDPETSHSTVEMRRAIVTCSLALFQTKNVRFEGSHAIIDGKLGQYTVHLGSGVVHQIGNAMLFVVPVHAQHRGRIFLPFVDDDPKTAEIVSKILLFAEDTKIKDPKILEQIQS